MIPAIEHKPLEIALYGLVLTAYFLLFQQADLFHTAGSSLAYLKGHFLDFYEFNKPRFYGNDYLPTIYALFAAWNLPLTLLGFQGETQYVGSDIATSDLSIPFLIWSKLLFVLFFFATVIMTYKSAKVITGGDPHGSRLAALVFATAPIAIFSAFIFGQYDVIALFFVVTGFYYYLRKDNVRFPWFFSIAISCKYFPIVIFVPLLMLAEKRLVFLLKLTGIALSLPALMVAVYWLHSPAFGNAIFQLPLDKINKAVAAEPAPYLVFFYAAICLYAFLRRPSLDQTFYRNAVFVTIAALGVMFSAIIWHPQWLILTTPFFALSYLFVNNRARLYVFDIMGITAFVWIVVNKWPEHVDVSLLNFGFFSAFFDNPLLINSDLMPASWLPLFGMVFSLYLFSPFLARIFDFSEGCACPIPDRSYLWARFTSLTAVFVIPSLLCVSLPLSVAEKIHTQAFLRQFDCGLVMDDPKILEIPPHKPTGELYGNQVIVQTFRPERDKLAAISVPFATYMRVNDVAVDVTLQGDGGQVLTTHSIAGKDLKDSVFLGFLFPEPLPNRGLAYRLVISSPNGRPGNAITAYTSSSDIYKDGALTIGNEQQPGDLIMRLCYAR